MTSTHPNQAGAAVVAQANQITADAAAFDDLVEQALSGPCGGEPPRVPNEQDKE